MKESGFHSELAGLQTYPRVIILTKTRQFLILIKAEILFYCYRPLIEPYSIVCY
jgi:hypothetical protein